MLQSTDEVLNEKARRRLKVESWLLGLSYCLLSFAIGYINPVFIGIYSDMGMEVHWPRSILVHLRLPETLIAGIIIAFLLIIKDRRMSIVSAACFNLCAVLVLGIYTYLWSSALFSANFPGGCLREMISFQPDAPANTRGACR